MNELFVFPTWAPGSPGARHRGSRRSARTDLHVLNACRGLLCGQLRQENSRQVKWFTREEMKLDSHGDNFIILAFSIIVSSVEAPVNEMVLKLSMQTTVFAKIFLSVGILSNYLSRINIEILNFLQM